MPERLVCDADPHASADPRLLEEFRAHERARLSAAAGHAARVDPGLVGEHIARELAAYAEFGYRFAKGGLPARVAREVLKLPVAAHRPGPR